MSVINTSISEIYDNFLSNVSDYTFLEMTDDEIDEHLFTYFKSAKTKFYKCKSNLTLVEDAFGEKWFTTELHPMEIEILTALMHVQYMKAQVMATEVIKQSLSDKSFRIYSQANQLRELNITYRMLRTEAKKMITEYTYLDLGKERN